MRGAVGVNEPCDYFIMTQKYSAPYLLLYKDSLKYWCGVFLEKITALG
jgi:hypothetical protein